MDEAEGKSKKGKAVKVYTVNVERLKEIVEVAITQFNELLDEDDRWLDPNSPQFMKQYAKREELVAQIKEDCKISVFGGSTVEYVRLGYLLNVIKNHGLEE